MQTITRVVPTSSREEFIAPADGRYILKWILCKEDGTGEFSGNNWGDLAMVTLR